ncbi:hypothetical protein D9756_009317 [Leucocoprinus leucothites]|uniref:Uncharacterized protein n=1 Tax=Leucocoprinus leucothites TaxID=201217 RepID=A0A8H5CX06_9AGAR|nr:hypothetical protein D9756_009317 [Leucoagaricus leucothites]
MTSPAYDRQGSSSTHSIPASLTPGNALPMPIPVLLYNGPKERPGSGGGLSHSPGQRVNVSSSAMSPHQVLPAGSGGGGVQLASYHDEKYENEDYAEAPEDSSVDLKWLPLPLRLWFWIPFVLVRILGAIGLEMALHSNKKSQGWKSIIDIGSTESALHYAFTLPPVIVAAVTWTDIEIKKIQPYVDLVHGDSPPHRSLLLDYTRYNQASSSSSMLSELRANRLLGVNIFNQRAIGLNQNNQFNDLTSFLTAPGYAGASILYDLGDPPFIRQGYTAGLFDVRFSHFERYIILRKANGKQFPTSITSNGSVTANTAAVKSISNCAPVSTATGWDDSVSSGNCNIAWSVDQNATTLFGTDTMICNLSVPEQFSPIVFWFFTYDTTPPQSSAAFCSPSIELWDVEATADFSSLAGNVTGVPLEGRAYNGVRFNLTEPDEFITRRLGALQLQLPVAIIQAAAESPEGVIGRFDANNFADLATRVYTTYLALIASTVYFLRHQEPLAVEVSYFQKRVWLGEVAVHLLAAIMLLLALFATLIQLFHRRDRRHLRLKHEPGTIASAVSIGAQTEMGDLLAGRQRAEEMDNILRGKRFRIEPRTMKIIMEDEEGYDISANPMDRRRSIIAALRNERLGNRRFSA